MVETKEVTVPPESYPPQLTQPQLDFVIFYPSKDKELAETLCSKLGALGYSGCLYDDSTYLPWCVSLKLSLIHELTIRASLKMFLITENLGNDPMLDVYKGEEIEKSVKKNRSNAVPVKYIDELPDDLANFGWRAFAPAYPNYTDSKWHKLFGQTMTGKKQREKEQSERLDEWIEDEKRKLVYNQRLREEKENQKSQQFEDKMQNIQKDAQEILRKEELQKTSATMSGNTIAIQISQNVLGFKGSKTTGITTGDTYHVTIQNVTGNVQLGSSNEMRIDDSSSDDEPVPPIFKKFLRGHSVNDSDVQPKSCEIHKYSSLSDGSKSFMISSGGLQNTCDQDLIESTDVSESENRSQFPYFSEDNPRRNQMNGRRYQQNKVAFASTHTDMENTDIKHLADESGNYETQSTNTCYNRIDDGIGNADCLSTTISMPCNLNDSDFVINQGSLDAFSHTEQGVSQGGGTNCPGNYVIPVLVENEQESLSMRGRSLRDGPASKFNDSGLADDLSLNSQNTVREEGSTDEFKDYTMRDNASAAAAAVPNRESSSILGGTVSKVQSVPNNDIKCCSNMIGIQPILNGGINKSQLGLLLNKDVAADYQTSSSLKDVKDEQQYLFSYTHAKTEEHFLSEKKDATEVHESTSSENIASEYCECTSAINDETEESSDNEEKANDKSASSNNEAKEYHQSEQSSNNHAIENQQFTSSGNMSFVSPTTYSSAQQSLSPEPNTTCIVNVQGTAYSSQVHAEELEDQNYSEEDQNEKSWRIVHWYNTVCRTLMQYISPDNGTPV